jgi:gluconokinase
VEATLEAMRAVAAELTARSRIAGIAFSAAMHSLVGLDAGGDPLTPLLTWADTRAAAQAERLRRARPELHDRTGTPLHPMAPLVKLVWFRESQPALVARVRRWVGIKELVVAQVTGEWMVDASCASGTGLMAIDTLDWDGDALTLAGVGRTQLSTIVPSTHTLPLTRADIGVATGTPVVVGAGDGPLANVGVGAVRRGVAACSIGTSGALRLVVDHPGVDRDRRVFCYALTPGRWVVGGAISNGGSVLQWARAALAPELGEHAEDELLELASRVDPGSGGLLMVPSLHGERAPRWSAVPGGAYVGLTHLHGRAHLVRAAIEGVCMQLALVLASLSSVGYEVREVRATGGFARSPVWRQMLADVLGSPIGFTAEREGSALGAAIVGMEALGLVDSIDTAAELVSVTQTIDPDPAAAPVYASLLPLFARVSEELVPTLSALHGPAPR